MRDRDLYAQILGLQLPWKVVDVQLSVAGEEVKVFVEATPGSAMKCPDCGTDSPTYDHRRREWRHLDTCQFKTTLVADVPRVDCAAHGVKQVKVPWAEPSSGFTALFEAVIIDWLKEASISAVSRLLSVTWDEADGVMQRAVARGLARREPEPVRQIGVDETSFQKRHEYVTVVTNLENSKVVYVADDRKTTSLDGFYEGLTPAMRAKIEIVAIDMHGPFIRSTENHVPDAGRKIVFDKFHVAGHLGDAVDQVRRIEHRELTAEGDMTLAGSKYLWLTNPDNMDIVHWESSFKILRESSLRTSRAWALKEFAMRIWNYRSRGWAKKAWTRWTSWAKRSRLEPMKKVADMITRHLYGILNAIVTGATNATAESINSKIQKVKRLACGFRNRTRFRNAIYFHLGGLHLYPASARITHTDS